MIEAIGVFAITAIALCVIVFCVSMIFVNLMFSGSWTFDAVVVMLLLALVSVATGYGWWVAVGTKIHLGFG